MLDQRFGISTPLFVFVLALVLSLAGSHPLADPVKYNPKPKQRLAKTVGEHDPLANIIVMTDFEKAEVTVDGEPYEAHLDEGLLVEAWVPHEVVVKWSGGKEKTYEVRLRKGEIRVIMVDLSNESRRARTTNTNRGRRSRKQGDVGYISVNSQPSGRVFIDGRQISDSTPLVKREVTPGQHAVRVFFSGSRTYSKTKKVVVHKGNHINLYFQENKK